MPIKPVLTTEDTRAGEAVVLKDGWPLVETDQGQVPWDIAKQAAALVEANTEAKERREALEAMAKTLGLNADVRSPAGLQALRAEIEKVPAITKEHEALMKAKKAGELDHTAEDKIKAAAEQLRTEELQELAAARAKAEKEAAEARAGLDRAQADLSAFQTRQGLANFHRQHKPFASGTAATFEVIAMQPQADGFRWRPTGKVDDNGQPILALMDGDGNIRKGPDQVSPLTLESWAESSLKRTHPTLFTPNGSTGDVSFDGSTAGKPLHQLPKEQLAALAYKEAAAAGHR